MSYLPTAKLSQAGNFGVQPTKTYVSTGPFNTKLFVYSTSVNSSFQTVGTLSVNSQATAGNCPINRVLQTNGRYLLPGVHPSITQPYLGVYDPITGLNGFIDPTDPTFSVYDVNFTPYQYNVGLSSPVATLAGQGASVRAGLDSGELVQSAANANVNAGAATTGEVQLAQGSGWARVLTTAVTANSRILLQQTAGVTSTIGGVANVPVVSSIVDGSFVIGLTHATPIGSGVPASARNEYVFFVAK
jgi:hypothetical protein